MKRDIYRWSQTSKPGEGSHTFAAELPAGANFRTAMLAYTQSSLVAGLAKTPLVPIYSMFFDYDPEATEKVSREFMVLYGGQPVVRPHAWIYLWTVFEPREGQFPNPIMLFEVTEPGRKP